MRSAPLSVLLCLCASILWSGFSIVLGGRAPELAVLAWFIAPVLVGGLVMSRHPLRRQGIALMLGPAVTVVTGVGMLAWIVILGTGLSIVDP